MNKQDIAIKFEVINFEGTKAILSPLEDNSNSILKWPINKLPAEIKAGDKITFKILTVKDLEKEHENIARKLLEEMIN